MQLKYLDSNLYFKIDQDKSLVISINLISPFLKLDNDSTWLICVSPEYNSDNHTSEEIVIVPTNSNCSTNDILS